MEERPALTRAARPTDEADWGDLSRLDVGRGASWLSGIEKDVILEINKTRSDPHKWGRLYAGDNAAAEATLRASQPMQLVAVRRGLCPVPTGATGATSERGDTYGRATGSWRRMTVSGPYDTARKIVLAFLKHPDGPLLDRMVHIGVSVQPDWKHGTEATLLSALGYDGK
jgi:hypothetical protein